MNLAHQETHAGFKVKIYYDPDPINPRKDYDTAVTIAHWHRKYDLGIQAEHGLTAEMIQEAATDAKDPILAILPVYLMDHSGVSINVRGFYDGFDSGHVGWAYITASDAGKMGYEGLSTAEYEDIIKSEVETYDAYLRGNVYGYVVESRNGLELESCWGYLGDMNYCLEEGKSVADSLVDPAIQEEADELASRATYAGVA